MPPKVDELKDLALLKEIVRQALEQNMAIDIEKLGEVLGTPTVGATRKRLSRFKVANGIESAPKGMGDDGGEFAVSKAVKKAPSKKRAFSAVESSDDETTKTNTHKKPRIQKAKKGAKFAIHEDTGLEEQPAAVPASSKAKKSAAKDAEETDSEDEEK